MKTLQELKDAREEAKRRFQEAYDALAPTGETVFVSNVARARFEELCEPKTLHPMASPQTAVDRQHWIPG